MQGIPKPVNVIEVIPVVWAPFRNSYHSECASARILVALMALSVLTAVTPTATAATKTITCYRGKIVKKVTAASPKCPTEFTTKKPA